MARTRRTYTTEFKAEAVKLVTEQGYSVAEAARSLGIKSAGTRRWGMYPQPSTNGKTLNYLSTFRGELHQMSLAVTETWTTWAAQP